MTQALIVAGFGLNCERETKRAFEMAGADARIVHLTDLAATPSLADDAPILAIPGGFSFGDHLGAGNALAGTLEAKLGDLLRRHVERGRLLIGVCNGCQTLVRLGLLGADVSLTANASGAYVCRWVRLRAVQNGPWLDGLETIDVPVAHGEGRFVSANASLDPALVYVVAEDGREANPNGSEASTAAVTASNGAVLAIMPHPERALEAQRHPEWTARREHARRSGETLDPAGDGLALFKNGVRAARSL